MKLEADSIITQSVANRDFRKVCRLVDQKKYAVILRYSEPRYIMVRYDEIVEALEKLGFVVKEKK